MDESNKIRPIGNENFDESDKTLSEIKTIVDNVVEDIISTPADDAGPSSCDTTTLPGSITSKNILLNKAGKSKSEVNIRQIITGNDNTNTLTLTSISFGPNAQNGKEEDIALQNFAEIRKLLTSTLKFHEEENTIATRDAINLPIIVTDRQDIQNANTTTNSISQANMTDTVEILTEVNISNYNTAMLSKVASENSKKKMSGNISERSDLGLAQRDSLSSIGSNVCRICMTRGKERLISPCNCKGSLANVHLSCLERWLNQVGRNHCELCGYSYPAIRTPRYTVLQALRLWFGNPRNRSHLQSDCLIFWLLSTVTAGLLAVCIVGTQYFVIEGNKVGISHRITETAMDFFMAIVLCGYSVTVYLLWKDHYVMWNRWRRANVNVRLLLTPDSNPVPFVPRSQYNV